ncbi:MAG: hypothetical protein ACE365_05955 [Gammaproteobacteria bacterium]
MKYQEKGKLSVVTWPEIRSQFAKLQPKLAQVIDELSPSDDHFFVKCSYPFGSQVLKKAELMIPAGKDGRLVPLSDPDVDPKIKNAISYNLESNPVSMVLKNSFEIFLTLPDRTVPFLDGIIPRGAIIGTYRTLNPEKSYQPKFIWDMAAGARSMFMLPKISEAKKHMKLKKEFDLQAQTPTNLMSHWEVFKGLAQHPDFPQPWDAEILFFSNKWFEHLDDLTWNEFYYHIHRMAWKGSEATRNQPMWNLIYSLILQGYQGKPSAYICDTAKFLMYVGVGAQPAIAPTRDNICGPIAGLQKIYKEIYDIRGYPPIIMAPATFKMDEHHGPPVYYSLQFPTAMEFGKSSRARTSFIQDLHEIRSLLIRYELEILSNKYQTKNTPMHDLFHSVQFDYFHNNVELHAGMKNSKEIVNDDPGLLTTLDGEKYDAFPDMCTFVKGCIRISHKKTKS